MSMGNEQSRNNTLSVIKRAVLIGINYTGTDNQLNGCINDSENLKEFLVTKKFFGDNEIIMMNDNKEGDLYPTKANIIKQFTELVDFANQNKDKEVRLFLSYSGHGYYQRDLNGDEKDGRDEVLCPIDCDTNGFIVDDDIKQYFVDKLHSNVKVFVLADCCHSGTIMDLKYTWNMGILGNTLDTNNKIKDSLCDVVMISGCKDAQTSADAYVADTEGKMEYQGAMTSAFLHNFKDGITYTKLMSNMRKYLVKNRFTQVPLLSCGKKINLGTEILLCKFD